MMFSNEEKSYMIIEELYQKLSDALHNAIILLHSIGDEYDKKGQHQKAFNFFYLGLAQVNALEHSTNYDLKKCKSIFLKRCGVSLMKSGKYSEALGYFDKSLEIDVDPNLCANIIHALLECSLEHSRYPGTQDLLTKVLQYDFEDSNFLFAKGNFFLATQDYEQALECFSKVLEIGPSNNWQIFYHTGYACLQLGQHEQAIIHFDKVLELESSLEQIKTRALNFKGNCCVNLGNHEEALASFNAALELAPADQNALKNKQALEKFLEEVATRVDGSAKAGPSDTEVPLEGDVSDFSDSDGT